MNTAGPRRAAPNGHSIGRTSLPNSVAVAAIGSEIQHRDDVTAVERTRFSTLPVQTCASTTKRGGRAPGCEQHQRSAHRGSQRHADKPTEADRENTSIPTILHLRLLVDFQMASLSIFLPMERSQVQIAIAIFGATASPRTRCAPLEDAIFEDVDVDDLRVSLMGGPILRKNDPKFEGIPIPTEFWKLVACTDNADGEDKVRARAAGSRVRETATERLGVGTCPVHEHPPFARSDGIRARRRVRSRVGIHNDYSLFIRPISLLPQFGLVGK